MPWLTDTSETRKMFIEKVKYGYDLLELNVYSMYISFLCPDRKVTYNSLFLLTVHLGWMMCVSLMFSERGMCMLGGHISEAFVVIT
jgi:hypothetical protein